MVDKVVLDPIQSGYDLSKVNANFQRIEDELNQKVLYRNNTTGADNTIQQDIDVNGRELYNVGAINGLDASFLEDISTTLTAVEDIYDQFDDRYLGSKTVAPTLDNDGNPLVKGALYYNELTFTTYVWTGVEWIAFNDVAIVREEITATEGQTVFNLSTLTYTPGISGLFVYIDGARQFDTAYTETNSSTVTLSEGVPAGTKVLFEAGSFTAGLILNNASAVAVSPAGGISSTNVQDALLELDGEKLTNNVSATNKVLGRRSGGAGVIEEIGLGTGFSFTGSDLVISSLPNGVTATTQAQGDNSTKVATTAYADAQKGTVVQVVKPSRLTAYQSFSTVIPWDDTIPQITEGTEIFSATITPTSASNVLYVDVDIPSLANATGQYVIAALFKEGTPDAVAASIVTIPQVNYHMPVRFLYNDFAGTTSPITFKLRVGANTATTTFINGAGGTRKLGGITGVSITITEVRA